MKICKLKFQNINNLKGEHQIEFENAPLVDAGLFAILGPTGSGKSSILDVITLALFNKVPRFSAAITKNEILEKGSIMTHHTQHASAEITYEIKGKRYTSTWSISYARTGTLKDHEMYLYDQDGKVFDLKKSQVPSKNEDIIGLSYDQFIRSILLSQGEFAKFLKANKHERGQLLENITGTEIYRKLGAAIFQKAKMVKEHIKSQKEKLGFIELIPEEEIKQLELENTKTEKDHKQKQKLLTKLIELQQKKQELNEVKSQLKIKEQRAIQLVSEWKVFQPQLQKLELNNKLNPLRVDISNFDQAQQNAEMSSQNLKDYTADLKDAKLDLSKVIKSMSDLISEAVDQDNFKTKMSAFESRIIDLDNKLSNLAEKGKEERIRVNKTQLDYEEDFDLKVAPGEALKLLEKQRNNFDESIEKAGLDDTSNVEKELKYINESKSELQLWKELELRTDQIEQLRKKIMTIEDQSKKLTIRLDEHKVPHQQLKKTLKILQENIELLENAKMDAIRIAQLEDHRKTLVDGKACPLCGSLEHPLAHHADIEKEALLDVRIRKAKSEHNTALDNFNQSEKTLVETNTQKQLLDQNLKDLKTTSADLEKQIQDLQKRLKLDDTLNYDEIKTKISTINLELEKRTSGLNALNQKKINLKLNESYRLIEENLHQYLELKQKRNALYPGDDITRDCNQLQDRFVSALNSISELSKSIVRETKDLEGANKLKLSLEKSLVPKISELGIKNISDVQSYYLSDEEITKIDSKRDSSLKQQTIIETELQNLKTKKTTLEKDKNLASQNLESIEKDLEKLQVEFKLESELLANNKARIKLNVEKQNTFKKIEKEISSYIQDANKWDFLNKMLGDKNGNNFANFAQALTLKNLLVYANRRLAKMTDRYLLDLPKDEDTLRVIDLYQGNIRRSVATLSGGESFLISLALALSLSDMSSKNIALDSLFIDEGFGTLDKDSLDIAMVTLEKLQSESQKMVGVISHVEALKERINVQIVLEKDAQGYSSIRIED